MAKYGYGHKFHALKYFEVGLPSNSLNYCKIEAIVTKICEKTHQFNIYFIIFETNLR